MSLSHSPSSIFFFRGLLTRKFEVEAHESHLKKIRSSASSLDNILETHQKCNSARNLRLEVESKTSFPFANRFLYRLQSDSLYLSRICSKDQSSGKESCTQS
jgi:hypothetical protein